MPAPTPRMHGIGHRPGGPDPITGYLAFDTDPQSGGFLEATTTGPEGIHLSSDGVGGNATLNATHGDVQLTTLYGDAVVTSLAGGIHLTAGADPIFLSALGGTTESQIQMRVSAGNYVSIMDNTPIEQFRLTIGGTGTQSLLQLADATGALVFKVDANGNAHLKAGATLTYDL